MLTVDGDSLVRLALAPHWRSSAAHEHGRLAGRVADVVANAIIDWSLPPGTRLSEETIADALGISRTPVREALRELASEYLVDIRPNRGAWVTELSAEDAVDVYVCRAHLYGLAAKMAAAVASNDELAELKSVAQSMERATASGDIHRYFDDNLRFHDLVAQAARSKRLLAMINDLGRTTLRFRYLSITIPGRMEESMEFHRQLIRHLDQREGEAAEAIVQTLIKKAGQAVLTHYFRSQDNDGDSRQWADRLESFFRRRTDIAS